MVTAVVIKFSLPKISALGSPVSLISLFEYFTPYPITVFILPSPITLGLCRFNSKCQSSEISETGETKGYT